MKLLTKLLYYKSHKIFIIFKQFLFLIAFLL